MGCDIHLFVEKRVDGKWVTADDEVANPYYDTQWDSYEGKPMISQLTHDKYWDAEQKEAEEEGYSCRVLSGVFYRKRNYFLFSILANVRNGRGFAGRDTGDGFVPIDMPRGLPGDVSEEVAHDSECWGADGHSHSYFTVAELLAYDWQQITTMRGTISEEVFSEWVSGNPREWYSEVGRGEVVSNDTMLGIVTGAIPRNGKAYYTKVSWEVVYSECAEEFVTETIPLLKAIGNPQDVRIVFWFDN